MSTQNKMTKTQNAIIFQTVMICINLFFILSSEKIDLGFKLQVLTTVYCSIFLVMLIGQYLIEYAKNSKEQ